MNENINNEIKKEKEIEVISDDLFYQDAVLEIIKDNKEIDYILINENLPGDNIEDFINKINNIKTIIFVENYEKNAKKLIESGAYKVYENGKITLEEIINIIKKEDETEILKKEIETLKKIIFEKDKDKNYFLEKIKNYIKKAVINKENSKNSKLISVVGLDGIEKSIFSFNLAKELEKNKNKTLLIDLDMLNNYIDFYIGNKNIQKNMVTKNKYLDFLSGKNLILKNNEKIEIQKFKESLKDMLKKYQYVIINTSMECFFDYMKIVTNESNKIFLIEETDIYQKNIINILKNNWRINENLLEIIISQTEEKKREIKGREKIILKNKIKKRNSYIHKIRINKNINNKIDFKYRRLDYINIYKEL